MKTRLRGQITILASLVIVLIISLVCTCIKSAADSITKTNINMACNMSIESLFSEYFRPLQDEFDVMFIKDDESLNTRLTDYLVANTKTSSSFNKYKLLDASISEKVMATDNGASAIKNEVLDYMKFGAITELTQDLIDVEEEIVKADKTNEIVDQIVKCEEYTEEIDENILDFIRLVEGVSTTHNGFTSSVLGPAIVNGAFAKKIIYGSPSMDKVGINDALVFVRVKSEYVNVEELLSDIWDSCNEIEGLDPDKPADWVTEKYYSVKYWSDYSDLANVVRGVLDATTKAISIVESYNTNVTNLLNYAGECTNNVNSVQEILGEDLAKGFKESLNTMSDFNEDREDIICKMQQSLPILQANQKSLEEALEVLDRMGEGVGYDNASYIKSLSEECDGHLRNIDISSLKFNYDNVTFNSSESKTNVIRKIEKYIKEGILGLVIEDENKISKKSIKFNNLASNTSNVGNGFWTGIKEASLDNILYNEYLLNRLKSYTDSLDEQGNTISTDSLLDYTVEYIIAGQKNDRDNLSKCLTQLVNIKMGTNLAYLYTDSEKKTEAYTLALALVGFTGMPAVIYAAQFLIMTVWAYAEAIIDVQKLCNGENVKLIKIKQDWQLSLENLLQKKFTYEKQGISKEGFSYEAYIRMLLFIMKPEKKYFRTYDVMELRMMELGFPDFRMKNYIYSMSAEAAFKINRSSNYHIQNMDYQY